MPETKHTPGPWQCGGECQVNMTFDREAAIYPPSHELTGGYQYGGPIAVVSISDDAGELANARLIAAAPDLLAACQKLDELDWCIGYELGGEANHRILDEAVELTRAAISKATQPQEAR